MADLSTPLLDAVNTKLLNPTMSCGGRGPVVRLPLSGGTEETPSPTRMPTNQPTHVPTNVPTPLPTGQPTSLPTSQPTTGLRTSQPTNQPTPHPTGMPITSGPTKLANGEPCSRGSDCNSGICSSNGEDGVVCVATLFCRR